MIEKETGFKPINREQVVAAFKELKTQRIENPWEQNTNTADAWKLYREFCDIETKKVDKSDDPKAPLVLDQQISIDMIITEAGFEPDEDNLETILDFLEQDLETAKDIGDTKLISELQEKIKTYQTMYDSLSE